MGTHLYYDYHNHVMQEHLWKTNIEEFDNIEDLKKLIYELNPMVKKGEADIVKVFRAADGVYFIRWNTST
jgi:hypothetical protein